jgi:glycosyltransferase involved in cell wall biosynthesis
MRIALNVLYIRPGKTGGTETYARALIRALAEIDGQNEYRVFCNQETAELDWPVQPNVTIVRCPPHAGDLASRFAWEQFVLPIQLRRHRIDVVHSLGYVAPLMTGFPSIVSIHDANYVSLRKELPWLKSHVLRRFVSRSAANADLIITGSEFGRQEVLKKIAPGHARVAVTPYGADHVDNQPTADWKAIAKLYGLTTPYLLTLGRLERHKNVKDVVDAYATIAGRIQHSLVITGRVSAAVRQRILALGLEQRIRLTGYVPDCHLPDLFMNADLFLLASGYEGFGFPLLEAQRLGVPVVASRIAALKEIAGDWAIFFHPGSVHEIANIIVGSLENESLRTRLSENGRANARRFLWLATADATLRLYRAVHDLRCAAKIQEHARHHQPVLLAPESAQALDV